MTERAPLTLGDLFREAQRGPWAAQRISGLAFDSRKVTPGAAFVAIPGTAADGRRFIPQALAAGAAAVVAEGPRPAEIDEAVPFVAAQDSRRALALAAARLHPRQPESIVAVTGTAGKSSVADFVRQLFAALGRKSASLGTLGVVTSDGAAYGSLTTPDPLSLHQALERLAGEGVTHLAMEASSHGIEQRRLDGVRLTAGAFTNLGHDHLDYHRNMEAYREAKLRLFETLLPEGATAVVNADGAMAEPFLEAAALRGLRLMTTGRAGDTIQLLESRTEGFAQKLRLRFQLPAQAGREFTAELPLVGAFQVENALVAAGLVLAADSSTMPEAVFAALSGLRGVSGRLERVGEVGGALCIVDYAHKPEALGQVLDALRPFANGRLYCVFGCGGDRDRAKRPIMGAIAIEKADVVIVTDDNPRSEEPAAIRAAILSGAAGAREIGDRAEAIRTAVRELESGDVLVVAGKGHETGQIVGERTLPFSDHDVLRTAIAERSGR